MNMKGTAAKALALFDRYAEMPHTELSKALVDLQHQDAELCAALMRLLVADEQTHSFASPLEWIAAETGVGRHGSMHPNQAHDQIWPIGTRIGPWCVDGIIGLGGMGVIYAARRADGFYEREVALKTIRAEIMSPTLQQAFAKERSHLAKLEHPSIVALHDAGITDDGQPWLAMQRVHGDAIDQWCDTRSVNLRARVRLLVDACDAISYAHAHGVLHQDIKPSNLLVTDDGKVKLLDFGLSAVLSQSGDCGYIRIGVSSAYAANEVFEGAPPSVAIDVYALGVVLYRLLCDAWPRAQRSLLPLSPPPSTAVVAPSVLAMRAAFVTAHARSLRDMRSLSCALRGDLDQIAMRCVHDDPVERYPSVADLRADLRAWLEHRPVEAARGSWLYHSIRFLRRNAVAVAAIAVVAIGSMTAGLMAWQQQQRARLEAENTEALSHLFEDSIVEATLNALGSAPANTQTLLDDAERRLRSVAGDDRPVFLARGLTTLAHAYQTRSDYARAERLLIESKGMGGDDPLQTARNDAALANVFNKGARMADAQRLAREGLAILPQLDGVEDDMVRTELQFQLARSLWLADDAKSALPILDEALGTARHIGVFARSRLASLLRQRATVLAHLGRVDEAEQDLREALVNVDAGSLVVLNQVRETLALILAGKGDVKGGQRLAAVALMDSINVLGPSHAETGRAWLTMAKTWEQGRSDPRRAHIALRQSEAILVRKFGAEHSMLLEVYVLRRALALENGAKEEGVAHARRAVDVAMRSYGCCTDVTLRRKLDLAMALIAFARGSEGREREAPYREAESVLMSVIREGESKKLKVGYAHTARVWPLLYSGDTIEAERQAQIGLDIAEESPANDIAMEHAVLGMARVRLEQRRYDDAVALVERVRQRLPALADEPYRHFRLHDALLDIETARGDRVRIRDQSRKLESIAERYGFMRMSDVGVNL